MSEGQTESGGRLVLAVTGSVAAVHAFGFVFFARERLRAEVRVIMSAAARRFITPLSFEVASCHPVLVDVFETSDSVPVPHLDLVTRASVAVVLPATANILAKSVAGIADDIVSTTLVAATCPLIYAPVMNASMWRNPVVQRNVRMLRDLGHVVVEPLPGREVSSGTAGGFVMPAFEVIGQHVLEAIQAGRRR